ncbi:MAG TPA: hypothetical protein VKU40_19165 [Thermoanaerobaculia bacterium]|nr:hypothetical protein [Thermoanaerobaculia bacterium]
MKRLFLTCGVVGAAALVVGFLLGAPAADAAPICLCLNINATVSGSGQGADCGAAQADLEQELRAKALNYCLANFPEATNYCGFEMNSPLNCYAIDFTGQYGSSGSATFDCFVCFEGPGGGGPWVP